MVELFWEIGAPEQAWKARWGRLEHYVMFKLEGSNEYQEGFAVVSRGSG